MKKKTKTKSKSKKIPMVIAPTVVLTEKKEPVKLISPNDENLPFSLKAKLAWDVIKTKTKDFFLRKNSYQQSISSQILVENGEVKILKK